MLITYWIVFTIIVFVLLSKNQNLDYSKYILAIGFIIGLILNVTSKFTLSEDIYRYLFDGFLVRNNVNPYLFTPKDPVVSTLVTHFPFISLINNNNVTSPYPPLSIFFSLIFVFIFGYSAQIWLLLMNVITTLTGYILVKLLINLELNKNLIALWSLNPNVLIEFNSSGHNDIISIFFLVISLYFLLNNDKNKNIILLIAGLFFSLSIGIKIFTIFFLPFLIKKLNRIGILSIALFTSIQFLLFYFLINRFSGIFVFIEYWRFNGGLFEFFYFILNDFNSSTLNLPLQTNIRILLASIFIFSYIFLFIHFYKTERRSDSLFKSFEYIGYSYLLFYIVSPVIHPWYLLWAIIPFIMSKKNVFPYWIFLFLVNLSYVYYLNPDISVYLFISEYAIFYLSLFVFIFKNKINIYLLNKKLKTFE